MRIPHAAAAFLTLFFALPLAGVAAAQEAQQQELASPPAGPATRVAVLLLATAGVEPSTADDLTEVLVSALAERGGFSMVGKEEFQSQLGQSERGSLECIGSVACIGQVGVQLGVEQAIAGTIALRDGVYVFNLNRIDVRSGETVGRAFREVRGDLGAVATELQRVLPSLFEAIVRPATIVVSSAVVGAEVSVDGLVVGTVTDTAHPVRTGDLPPGRHEVIVRAHGRPDWRRDLQVASGATVQIDASPVSAAGDGTIWPLFWAGLGVGAAALGTAIVFGVLSQDTGSGMALTRAQLASFYAERNTFAVTADILYGVAGAGAIAALIGLIVSATAGGGSRTDAAPASRARLDVTPLRGGALLGLSGEL